MKRKVGLLTVGLVVGLVCGFKWANFNYRRDQAAVASAQAAQAAANLNQAGRQQVTEVMNVIKKARENPNDFDAQTLAAEQFLQIRRPEGALEFLNNAIRLKPDDVDTMTRLSQAYFFNNQLDESIKWSRTVVRKQPDSEAALYYLTAALIVAKQNLNEAAQLVARLEKKRGTNDELLKELRSRLAEAQDAGGSGAVPAGATASPSAAGPSPSQSKTMLQHGPDATGVKK